jgi:hypothetical protein
MTKTVVIALALCFGTATFAAAQTSTVDPAATAGAQRADQNDPGKPFSEMEKEKIIAALSQMGYTAPSNFRRDGDGFLATAMKDSKQQDVWVDPQSGVIKPMSK